MTTESKELFIPIDFVSRQSTSQEVLELKNRLEKLEDRGWQIMYLVVGVFVATLLVVAVEIMLFHTKANQDYLQIQNQYFQEIKELQEKNYQSELRLQRELDELKPKLPPSVPPKQ